ncbi:MAG: ribonuclease III [bacterium]
MLAPRREKQLQELEDKIGTTFLNRSLLNQSLTHSSYAHEGRNKAPDNERMELLGDAVIKLVTSEYLYNKFPTYQEGDLTKIRAVAISDDILAMVAKKIRLGMYILLGSNERRTGGMDRKSNLANALEALIGAIHLDAGLGKARDVLLELLVPEIEKISKVGYIKDFKSALQEFVQKKKWGLPYYNVIKEVGLKHKKIFWMEVKIRGQRYGLGRGANKKEAEQAAAKIALSRLTGPQNKARNLESSIKKRIIKQK